VMARYAREMRAAAATELQTLKAKHSDAKVLETARRWLHRDDDKVPAEARAQVEQVRAASPVLTKMHAMREELRALWSSTTSSREQLAADLQAWCRKAEDSGIEALRQFSFKLRAAHV